MMSTVLDFTLGQNNRMLHRGSPHWRGLADARAYARKHGAAGIWRADGSFLLFYTENGKLKQKTRPKARPVNT